MRTLYVLLLGVGGWCAGALIVLTLLPAVPLDDELLAAFSIGIPIGLVVYLAWVQRGWSARTSATGFAAAVGGALVGAWLGFHTIGTPLALLTTVLGAIAGANLLLVGLDIAWDVRSSYLGRSPHRRQVADRFAPHADDRATSHP
jgi:CDP-diglyceride synthetase